MDHYCQWLGKSIGFYNYKYFVVMIIYLCLLMVGVVMTYHDHTGNVLMAKEGEVGYPELFLTSITSLLCLAIFIRMLMLLFYHLV